MRLPATILTTSAIAITALAIVEAGRLQPAAFAATAATGLGGVTAITSSVGQGPDDGIDSPTDRRLVLRGGASLPALFRAARGG